MKRINKSEIMNNSFEGNGSDELISVVIPVYNVEKYLIRCINSVINQTYSNIEIILVDDGSPDRCGDICDEYAKSDYRIRVIHKGNGGLSDARNVGIKNANGKYITLLDSDDWIDVEFLLKLYSLIKVTNSEIAISNYSVMPQENRNIENAEQKVYLFSNIEAIEHLAGDLYLKFVVAWGKLYHRSVFEGIDYPVGKIHEDEFTAHKLLYNAKNVVYTTEQLLYYWQRTDSIMGVGYSPINRIIVAHAYMDRAKFFDSINLWKARGKTLNSLFFIYGGLVEYMTDHPEESKRFMKEFNELKHRLHQENYALKFRIGYNLLRITPKTAKTLSKIYFNIKRIKII
jgi:glycosyltransferase involved in cell wall biosynthesis